MNLKTTEILQRPETAHCLKKEAFAVAEFIDCNLFDYIRNDTDVDSIGWLRNVLHAYEKMCKANGFVGLTENAEGEDDSN